MEAGRLAGAGAAVKRMSGGRRLPGPISPRRKAAYDAPMAMDQPSAGRFEGRVHLLPVRVYYEDTDFTGLVYHATYLRYLERGRSDYLRAIGVSHADLLAETPPSAYALTKIALEYRAAARIDDALLVCTTYDEVKGPRLRINQTITRGAHIVIAATVEACCISLAGRPKKPSPRLLQRLAPLLAPAASDF